MSKQRRKNSKCKNCQTTLKETINFCPNCGQENHDKIVSIKQIMFDFLGDYFAYDSKFFRSVRLLLFKPGQLTENYTSGQHIRYVPPIRLYVFVSIIFFFVIGINSNNRESSPNSFTAGFTSTIHNEPLSPQDSVLIAETPGIGSQMGGLQEVSDKMRAFQELPYKDQSKFMHRIFSWIIIIMMPLFGLLLHLFNHKGKRLYVESLVCSLHIHSFIFLIIALVQVLMLVSNQIFANETVETILAYAAILIPIPYVFLALKKFYKTRFWGTFFRVLGAAVVYGILLLLCFFGTFFAALHTL